MKKPVKKKKPAKEKKLPIVPVDPIEEALSNPIVIPKEEGEKVESENIAEKLTIRQEKFCQLYALDERFFGNGVQAYMEIYDIDTEKTGWYKAACACSSRLLSNDKVFTRINELLSEHGMNDQFSDKQLLFVMSQHSDLTNKMNAIKEYNKLKQRITEKMETKVVVSGYDLLNDIQS